ncbi:unnamed protein product [Cochlearia groenlandica]
MEHSTRSKTSNQKDEADVFTEFFGDSVPNPFAKNGGGSGEGGSGGNTVNEADVFQKLFENSFGAEGGGGVGPWRIEPIDNSVGCGVRKAATIERKLSCSLEDLYNGTTKKIRITREIVDVNRKRIQVEETLTVDVKAGWKTGTKITFAEKGNVQIGVVAADLVFIVDEKPHPVFTREGNDLIVTKNILVVDAFTGYTVNLTTLDGRRLSIPIDNVIHSEYEEVVPKEGMPLQKDRTKKGNLRIKFNIKYPTKFTLEQKIGLKKLLC